MAAVIEAFPDLRIVRLARTTSTQDVARRAARAGAPEGYCCVATEQTAGRGRQGRRWTAPSGAALLASVLLRPPAAVVGGVPIAAGLAVVDALAACAGVRARLKWPNDVMAGGRKLAGVLVEVEPAAAAPRGPTVAAVVGLGLNLTVDHPVDGTRVASLHQLTPAAPDREAVLRAWLAALGDRMRTLNKLGIRGLRDDWRTHATGLGEPVTAATSSGLVTGTAEDIDDTGALLIRTERGLVAIVAGDVHLATSPAGDPAAS